MKLPIEIIEYLRCPHTRQSLQLAPGRLAAVQAVHGLGVTEVLATQDGAYAYPVWGGIAGLLPDQAVGAVAVQQDADTAEKQGVQVFYDQVGWQQDEQGLFEDARRFEDLRPVVAPYIHQCHTRVSQHLSPGGQFLLDVASGPVQYDDYLEYSAGYQYRVCVDISIAALRAAQQRLGEKGIYVLGDITNLPFADDTFDGAISLHTIYHVPEAQQPTAFTEMHRVLKPGHQAVVVYSWGGHALLTRLLLLPRALWGRFQRLWQQPAQTTSNEGPNLTGHFFPYRWFKNQSWSFEWQVYVWRGLSVDVTRTYIHPWLGGRWLLQLWQWIEEQWPTSIARIGQYPMVVIKK